MLTEINHQKTTFLNLALLNFTQNVKRAFTKVNDWRSNALVITDIIDNLLRSLINHWKAIIGCTAFLVGVMYWILMITAQNSYGDSAFAKVVNSIYSSFATTTENMNLISYFIAFIVVTITISGLPFWGLGIILFIMRLLYYILTTAFFFLPLILWIPVYFLIQNIPGFFKLCLLVPLSPVAIFTQAIHYREKIFYTCLSRFCNYQGFPAYVCPHCGAANHQLRPNLFGLLSHPCIRCKKPLPTLGILGQDKLPGLCDKCETPLGQHTGQARERFIAVVGGTASGKTNYSLMAVHAIQVGTSISGVQVKGEIDVPAQVNSFNSEWLNLAAGKPASKTVDIAHANLLDTRIGRSRQQIYLYDAPGEESETIDDMTKQQYFRLLEGIIFCVDPLCFPSIQERAGYSAASSIPFQQIVESTVVTAHLSMAHKGKLPLRVAVMISKADLQCLRSDLGDITQGPIKGEICRNAIIGWGGESGLRSIEQRFESVAYFACSALGREVTADNRQPFKAYGVLEPLVWALAG